MVQSGFGIYDDKRNRELTQEEIEAGHFFMNHCGELIQIECTSNADSIWVCIARHPQDLYPIPEKDIK